MASKVKGTQTEKNLAAAFAGESMARNRYYYFSTHAEKRGYEQLAAVYLESAENEREHAKLFYKAMAGDGSNIHIRTTINATKFGCSVVANLKAAAELEHEEYTMTYPHYAEVARREGFEDIADLFTNIASIETQHEQRFLKLAQLVESGTLYKRQKIVRWKCRNCGYVSEAPEAPAECPACGHPQGTYELQEVLE